MAVIRQMRPFLVSARVLDCAMAAVVSNRFIAQRELLTTKTQRHKASLEFTLIFCVLVSLCLSLLPLCYNKTRREPGLQFVDQRFEFHQQGCKELLTARWNAKDQ